MVQDRKRVAEVSSRVDGDYISGSAYLVANKLLLTARHTVRGDPPERDIKKIDAQARFMDSKSFFKTRIAWESSKKDICLLKIIDDSYTSDALQPILWGNLNLDHNRGGNISVVNASFCGFPDAVAEQDGEIRNSLGFDGSLNLYSQERRGLFFHPITPNAPDTPKGWQGVSGAAVFIQNYLVGVVIETFQEYRGTIKVYPVKHLFEIAKFRHLLGVSVEDLIEVTLGVNLFETESSKLPPEQTLFIDSRDHSVSVTIHGDIINSQILVSGGDIYTNLDQGISHNISSEVHEKVLLFQADYEMLDISRTIKRYSVFSTLKAALATELRILFLAIPLEGSIVIPPTYYLESPLCRSVLADHSTLIDLGYIKLLTEYSDLEDYLARKRERYGKVSHYNRFKEAYFSSDDHGIHDLNFQLTTKQLSVGNGSLNLWNNDIVDRANQVRYPIKRIEEFRKLVFETEKEAFLHESVIEHMDTVGISHMDAKLLQVRELKSRNYLVSYIYQGICIPERSLLVRDLIVPSSQRQKYNIQSWRRIFESAGLMDVICSYNCNKLIQLKLKPEVVITITTIREHMANGRASDWIIRDMLKQGLFKLFIKNFC